MSFTQDELQAFNTILEQKLEMHRRALELSLDQRMSVLRKEFEQCLSAVQHDLLHNLPLRLSEQQNELKDTMSKYLEMYPQRVIEEAVPGDAKMAEMQAEISWDDLMDVIDKVVSARLSVLEGSIQAMVRDAEHSVLTQLHGLQSNLMQIRSRCTDTLAMGMNDANGVTGVTDIQDVFTSVEQLEHIVESLQVAMTANHTLLSNRLYHHQHQPFERAHPAQPPVIPSSESDGQDGEFAPHDN
jgi:flagellar biosynthesis/type III secretory pathway chaperone